MPEAIRVLIAEDAVLLREGLARLLADSGFDVVAKVDDGKGMVEAADALKPDVIVADVRMPPTLHRRGPARRGGGPGEVP